MIDCNEKDIRDSLVELTQIAYYTDELLFQLSDIQIQSKMCEIHNAIRELRSMVNQKFENIAKNSLHSF